jgi:hypothetical protein
MDRLTGPIAAWSAAGDTRPRGIPASSSWPRCSSWWRGQGWRVRHRVANAAELAAGDHAQERTTVFMAPDHCRLPSLHTTKTDDTGHPCQSATRQRGEQNRRVGLRVVMVIDCPQVMQGRSVVVMAGRRGAGRVGGRRCVAGGRASDRTVRRWRPRSRCATTGPIVQRRAWDLRAVRPSRPLRCGW